MLAAYALVASFLGATVIRAHGLDGFGWIALAALVLGLSVAAVLLAPWPLRFSIGARAYAKLLTSAHDYADVGITMSNFEESVLRPDRKMIKSLSREGCADLLCRDWFCRGG